MCNIYPVDYKNELYLRARYIDAKLAMREIADECGVSHPTIRRWLLHYKIKLRSGSELRSDALARRISADELHDLYWDQEKNLSEVARVLSVSPKTVRSAMVELGVERRSTKAATRLSHLSPAAALYRDKEWMQYTYHELKMSLSQIAKMLDCDDSTISKWLKRHGIETRGVSEALKLKAGW